MREKIGGDSLGEMKRNYDAYLAAYTGDNIQLKTSADRTAFRNAGAVFPNGAGWTTAYTGGSRNLWAPDLSYWADNPRLGGKTALGRSRGIREGGAGQ